MSLQALSILSLSVAASGAITKYRGVGYDGAQATVAGQKIMGIAETNQVDTVPVTLTVKGTAIVEAGAAINAGDALAMDNQGRAVPASALAVANPTVNAGAVAVTSSAANGGIVTQGAISGGVLPQYVFGNALQAAAGAGSFVEVLLR